MRGPSTSLHSHLPNDSSSSEDEEERLLREEEEEEEQERLLSRQYGEADESAPRNNNKKRSNQQTDAEIADMLNAKSSSAGGLGIVGSKRKKRIVLDETKLTSSKGLIFIRREFATKLRYKDPMKELLKKKPSRSSSEVERRAFKQQQFNAEANASAKYLSALMNAYQRFATDIAPNMHPTDTFNKIQDLGSKKVVRDYLNNMREEICKEHLNKIYGVKRTENLFNEYEHGLKALKEKLLDEENDLPRRGESNLDTYDREASNNLRASRNVGVLVENSIPKNDDKNGVSSTADDESMSKESLVNNDMNDNDKEHKTDDVEKIEKVSDSIEMDEENEVDDDDNDDEEEEATFDDVIGSTTIAEQDITKNNENSESENVADNKDKEESMISNVNENRSSDESVEKPMMQSNNNDDKEESMIVEFSQFEDTDIQEQYKHTQTAIPAMTVFNSFQNDEQLTLDVSQNFEETQTIVPSSMTQMTTAFTQQQQEQHVAGSSQNFDETQTIVPTTMTPFTQKEGNDMISQEY